MTSMVSTLQDIAITFNDGTTATPGEAFQPPAVLVVNVASKCGFTPQHEGLEELYQRYRERGLAVLGVTSNHFMDQEPGPDALPLYRELTAYPVGRVQDIGWNFEKFLVGTDGRILGLFTSSVEPLSEEIAEAVRAAH